MRWFEANGWLRDPASIQWPADPEHPANRARVMDDTLCPPLCWRERCHRAARCKHLMPLAMREFMPELGVYLARIHNQPQVYRGPLNADKLLILDEVFNPC